jgi:hypothetical protein
MFSNRGVGVVVIVIEMRVGEKLMEGVKKKGVWRMKRRRYCVEVMRKRSEI